MRILAASDIHGFERVYDWLVELACREKADALVLAGDLLGVPDGFETVEEAQAADRERICRQLDRFTGPVLYVMGNDDWMELDDSAPAHESVHGRKVTCGAYAFVGYPYTIPFMGGIHEKPEAEIAADLESLAPLVDGRTVLVTHGPAHGILDKGILDRHAGSPSLTRLIESARPRAHIHGHIHRAFGRQDAHFNVASGGRRRAMWIDLDSLEHEIVDAGD